jgi:hypothetical protein
LFPLIFPLSISLVLPVRVRPWETPAQSLWSTPWNLKGQTLLRETRDDEPFSSGHSVPPLPSVNLKTRKMADTGRLVGTEQLGMILVDVSSSPWSVMSYKEPKGRWHKGSPQWLAKRFLLRISYFTTTVKRSFSVSRVRERWALVHKGIQLDLTTAILVIIAILNATWPWHTFQTLNKIIKIDSQAEWFHSLSFP